MVGTLSPPTPEHRSSEGPRRLVKGSRINGLDGLRALAVVAVLLYHAGVPWARGGFLGVDVFFVLSGYLVTSLVLGTLGREGAVDLRAFWIGRARRLAPALVALLVTTTLAVAVLHRSELADLRGQVLSAVTGTTNWYLIASDSSYFDQLGRPPYLRHLWSIAVELQFYLVVPPLLALVLRREKGRLDRVAMGLVAAIVASVVWMAVLFDPATDPSRPYYSTVARLQAPLLGVLLALVWRRRNLVRGPVAGAGRALTAAGGAALAVLILLLSRAGDTDAWMYRGGFAVVALASVVVVAAVTHPSSGLGGPRFLGHPWLVAVGVRSYCLYLWHWPVYVLTRPGLDISWGWGPVFVLRIALTVALTEVCYRYVERPWHKGSRATVAAPHTPGGPGPRVLRDRRMATGASVVATAVAVAALLMARPQADAIEESLAAGQAALEASATSAPATTTTPRATTAPATTAPSGEGGATPPTSSTTTTTSAAVVTDPNVIVGDSVIVGAAPELLGAFPDATTIDAAVGRRASATADGVRSALAQRPDAEVVVVQMGNNGALSTEMIEEVEAAADGRRLLFINVAVPKGWEGEVNGLLDEVVPTLDDSAVIDWHGRSEGHDDWFLGDGVHLTSEGRAAFARAIAAAVRG